jgi:hypothetical protein
MLRGQSEGACRKAGSAPTSAHPPVALASSALKLRVLSAIQRSLREKRVAAHHSNRLNAPVLVDSNL